MRRWLVALVLLGACSSSSKSATTTTDFVASERAGCVKVAQLEATLDASSKSPTDYGVLAHGVDLLERTIPDTPLAPLLTSLHDAALSYASSGGPDSAAVEYSILSARRAITNRCTALG